MKSCNSCKTTQTPQWYSGPFCKACYRKIHRELNKDLYKSRDLNYYKSNKDKILKRSKIYYEENSEIIKSKNRKHKEKFGNQRRPGYNKKWRDENPEKTVAYAKKYRELHPERVVLSAKKHWQKNLAVYAKRRAMRHLAKMKRTPNWLTKEHHLQIESIFYKASQITKETGIRHEVDHIIPLQGKIVSGLNVPWNLQVLSKSENSAKNNRFDGTYDNLSWKQR